MDAVLAAIEASASGATMRRSVWLYPTANVLHVLGVMTFFAVVAAMDVAVFRGPAARVRAVIRRLRPYAAAALLVQIGTGFMLFAPEATHVGMNPAFQLKLAAIGLALLNIAVLESALRGAAPDRPAPGTARAAALASLALWLTVAALGRLIAYF